MSDKAMIKGSFWSGKHVLVTGCTGFLGSWLTAELVGEGAEVVGLVRDRVPASLLNRSGTADRIAVVRGDLEDYALLERLLGEYEVDSVFHIAAQAIVGVANRNPIGTFEANIRGTWNLLEACRRTPTIKRVIVASSDKAYGSQPSLPYTEDMPLVGKHPYDVSKSCADLIAQSYHATYGLPVCISRCGNLYGGGDLNFNRIVPGTIRSLLKNERPIIRSDGKFVRDYLFVRDAVGAYLHLGEQMDRADVVGQAYNFGPETRVTVLELTDRILTLMQRQDLPPVVLNEARAEIKEQYLSAEKARAQLGWTPRYTLDQGLGEAIEWYRQFLTAG